MDILFFKNIFKCIFFCNAYKNKSHQRVFQKMNQSWRNQKYQCVSHNPPLELEGYWALKDHLQGHLCCSGPGRLDKTCCMNQHCGSTGRISIQGYGPNDGNAHCWEHPKGIWYCNNCPRFSGQDSDHFGNIKCMRFLGWDSFSEHLRDTHGHHIEQILMPNGTN